MPCIFTIIRNISNKEMVKATNKARFQCRLIEKQNNTPARTKRRSINNFPPQSQKVFFFFRLEGYRWICDLILLRILDALQEDLGILLVIPENCVGNQPLWCLAHPLE